MTQSKETLATPRQALRGNSLRSKLFTPFIIILVLLGVAATSGALHLLRTATTATADERLLATQEILFREFKKQESLLEVYAVFLQHFSSLATRFEGQDEIGIIQDRLFNTLEQENVSVTFYPVEIAPLLQNQSLISLFEQVQRSGQIRFRYSNNLGPLPVLMVAAPIHVDGELSQILLLATEMGGQFLYSVANPLQVKAALMTLEGEVIARSHSDVSPNPLTPAQFTAASRGERLYFTIEEPEHGTERHQVSAIPLGNSDLVFLFVETSMAHGATAQERLGVGMIASIIGALLVGMVIYFRIIGNLIKPIRQLGDSARRISRGEFSFKLEELTNDEIGDVCHSFNLMLENLEQNYQKRSAADIEQALETEKHKQEAVLERKQRDTLKIQHDLHALQREMSAIYQLNQAMTTSSDLTVLFDRILQVINETLGCDHLVLLIYNKGESTLEVVRTAGIDFDVLRNIRFTFDQGITGEAAQSQRMIYVRNLDEDTRNLSYHGQIVTRGSMVSVPLVVKGRLCGIMNLHKKLIDGFSSSEIKLVQAIANQTAIAIDNNQLLEKTRNLSNTDELTGLANRRQFQEILKREVAQARRFSSYFSIIMCEVDHFRNFSETYGKLRSDTLLRQAGQLLLRHTRGIDLTCRFGSEQFVILLPKTDKKGALAAAEKLRSQVIDEEFDLGGEAPSDKGLSMSFGISQFPNDSKNIYELLSLADQALASAKKSGHNRAAAWGEDGVGAAE
ncbi:MAG: hypothetical protein C0614_02450 [Desulfuromonas sp.]|nr:MAG: hypothetical protein C0614_02450 [Desulfuromonas sp.]